MTSIDMIFVNPLPDTVYQPACRGQLAMTIERLEADGVWRRYWAADMLRCLSAPIVVAPGETYRDSLPVFGWVDRHSITPEFDPPPETTTAYRLAWHELVLHYNESGRPFGEAVPPFYSNAFRLRVER